jgi:hypothetical protein
MQQLNLLSEKPTRHDTVAEGVEEAGTSLA